MRSAHANAAPTPRQIALWVVLLAAALFLSLREYQTFQVGAYRDDAAYITLARSLIESNHFGLMNLPGAAGRADFPFGYPLLLTPLLLVAPNGWEALKLFSLAATLANAVLLFWGWRWFSRRSHWWSLAVTGLYLLSPVTMGHTHIVMSEPIFTTCALAAIALMARAEEHPPGGLGLLLLSGILVLLVFTRTLGWAILAGLVFYLLLKKGTRLWREMAVLAAGMLLLVMSVVMATNVAPTDLVPSGYAEQVTRIVQGKTRHSSEDSTPLPLLLAQYTGQHIGLDIPSALVPLGGGANEEWLNARLGLTFLPTLFRLGIFALMLFGTWRWLQTAGVTAFEVSAGFYLPALFVWQWAGARLLYPILPQLFFALLLGVEGVLVVITRAHQATRGDSLARAGVIAFAVCLALVSLHKNWDAGDSISHTGDLAARTEWLKANTPSSSVVMTNEPFIDFLYGARKTVPLGRSLAPDWQHIDYILIAPPITWQSNYAPDYDDETQQILAALQALEAAGRVTRVYAEGQNLLQVWQSRTAEK